MTRARPSSPCRTPPSPGLGRDRFGPARLLGHDVPGPPRAVAGQPASRCRPARPGQVGRPSSAAAASQAARRSAYPPWTRACGPACRSRAARPSSDHGTWRRAPDPRSRAAAHVRLGEHRNGLVHRAHRWRPDVLRLGAHARDDQGLGLVEPGSSPTAIAVAHSRAAELDSPAPVGTCRVTSTSRHSMPRAHSTPSDVRRPALDALVAGTRPDPAVRPLAPTVSWPSSRPRRDRRALGQGDGQRAAPVVVEVLSDQVHPAGGRHGDSGGLELLNPRAPSARPGLPLDRPAGALPRRHAPGRTT